MSVNQRAGQVTSSELKAAVWDKTGGICWYCGVSMNPFRDFSIDHKQAVARGGTNDIDNLVPCCLTCNSRKGDRDILPVQALPSPGTGSSLHTSNEAAAILGVSAGTIGVLRRYTGAGVRRGKSVYFTDQDIETLRRRRVQR